MARVEHKLFDTIIAEYNLKNDSEMCKRLEVTPPVVSKMRVGKLPVGPVMILNIHETFGMPIKRIKELIKE